MQVFTAEFGNYHRTRLTHTMEVVGIARTLGRAMGLNEDLIEAAALLHDIGHPPFGHAGEAVLDALLFDGESAEKLGPGFDHNGQALRIVEKLERRYAGFSGLNLSRELLDGQIFKQTKALSGSSRSPFLEIQIVDVADSIAYDTHDADDALEIGLLETGQLLEISLWKRSAERVRAQWTDLDDVDFRRAVVHDLIDVQVNDVLQSTLARIRTADIRSAAEALELPPLAAPSPDIARQKAEVEAFLMENVYRHPRIMLHRSRIVGWIETIFEYYQNAPETLPRRYESVLKHEGPHRAVADYIADLTDHMARSEAYQLARKQDSPGRSPIDNVFG